MANSNQENITTSIVTCSLCGNKISDPKLNRCPRCLKPLLKMVACSGSCSKCGEKGKTSDCC
ncbi:MAG: hypothetical protein WA118_09590 [Carboxydocellales bacterium]